MHNHRPLLLPTLFTAALFAGTVYAQEPVFSFTPGNLADHLSRGATASGNVTTGTSTIPYIDLSGNSHVVIPEVPFSQKGFTVEALVYLFSYAGSDPYISSIASAWDPDHRGAYVTEGVDFRIGGGYNYPPLPANAYDNVAEYVRPGSDRYERSKMSRCIGEFVLGTDESPWKELFTDCCIPLNEWVHMAATWDGAEMRIFLNGHDATDGWRTGGIDIPAFYNETQELFIGTDNVGALRDMNGHLGFFNLYDRALSLTEIREKYKASIPEGTCQVLITILSPRAGEVIYPSTELSFTVSVDGTCGVDDLTAESFIVEFSTTPDFSNIVYTRTITGIDVTLVSLLSEVTQQLETIMFIRILPKSGLRKTSGAAPLTYASMPVPFIFDGETALRKPGHTARNAVGNIPSMLLHKGAVPVYDLHGRKVDAAGLNTGSSGRPDGVYLVRYKGTVYTVPVFTGR